MSHYNSIKKQPEAVMKNYTFGINADTDYTCVGQPMSQSENILVEVPLTDEEVESIKLLVRQSVFDRDAGLMPVLKHDAPALYGRIDKAAREAILKRLRQQEAETIAIFQGEDCIDEDLLVQEEDACDVPYICHIPNY